MGAPPSLLLPGLVVADGAASLEVVAVVTVFVGAIALGVAVLIKARKLWRELADEPTTEDPIETYQYMLDEGIIDSQEFDRIVAQRRRAPDAREPEARPPDTPSGLSGAPSTEVQSGPPPRPIDLRAKPPSADTPSE